MMVSWLRHEISVPKLAYQSGKGEQAHQCPNTLQNHTPVGVTGHPDMKNLTTDGLYRQQQLRESTEKQY